MNHVFLILNYNTHVDTKICVSNIQKHFGNNACIVIVDNASTDNSFEMLQELKTNNVHVVSSGNNMGFANGNNFGLRYIRDNNIDVDYLHVLNSDIIIENDFSSIVENKNFSILGPDIKSLEGKSSSPIGYLQDNFDLGKYVKSFTLKLRIYKFVMTLVGKYLDNSLEKLYSTIISKKHSVGKNPVLSGCYLIFSKNYLDKYNKLFYEETFLYHEEVTLFYTMLNFNEKVVYCDDFEVIHHHRSGYGNWKLKAKCSEDNMKMLSEYKTLSTEELKEIWSVK